ncbi:MAG: fructosamine kinase family protein [Xanthomonadales bacterium]|nr:fructosamine kinase family protein [Xanthomonadales bacterium]
MSVSYPPILDELARGAPRALTPVGGGCIAAAAIASFADGSSVFVKRAAGVGGLFECEAEGLRALASAGVIRVPEVLAVSTDALVLERIHPGRKGPGFAAYFGRRFAALHRQRGKACGFAHDNFIGATPQPNRPLAGPWEEVSAEDGSSWPQFFLQRRLRYQVRLAAKRPPGGTLGTLLDRAEPRFRELLSASIEPPALLHGDLWSGNYLVDEHGRPCLIDPAVYYGHREADLAMTRLFGGFDADFYAAYEEAWPLARGAAERLPVYQLYHLLNHFNLFGGSYYEQSRRILERYAK